MPLFAAALAGVLALFFAVGLVDSARQKERRAAAICAMLLVAATLSCGAFAVYRDAPAGR